MCDNIEDSQLLRALRTISKCSKRNTACQNVDRALRTISYVRESKKKKSAACEKNMWILTRSSDFESNLAKLTKSIEGTEIKRTRKDDES